MKTEYFKINEFPLAQIVMRLILMSWIVFAVVQFNVNQFFFGFTIGVAILLILIITETSIEAKELFVEIKYKRWLPFLSKSEKIEYKDIADVSYIKPEFGGVVLLLNLIEYVPGTVRRRQKLHFDLNKDNYKEVRTFGSKSKNERMIRVILNNVEMIKNTSI